jgi:uracil-DNA glycosylase
VDIDTLVERLATTSIGETYNQYACGERSALLRTRLSSYLRRHTDSPILLVGEAPGYRGARISGIPFTSERQVTGCGPAEATATIVQRALGELELADDVLLWNVVPTHPGTSSSNRPPTRDEIGQGVVFARQLARGRHVIAVGRVAESAFAAPYVRHPSRGGACAFHAQLAEACADFVAQSHEELISF